MSIPGYVPREPVVQDARGTVYRATDSRTGRPVMVRVFPADFAGRRSFTERLAGAPELRDRVRHSNLVTTFATGAADGQPYVVMDDVGGYSLAEWLSRKGTLDERDVLMVAESVAAALTFAWNRARLVHGALSLDTIFVAEDGRVAVAELYGVDWQTCLPEAVADTYCPAVDAGDDDEACRPDLYALGALMSHLLTGRPPPPTVDATAAPAAVPLRARASAGTAQLIEHLTARAAARRYRTWTATLEDIRRVMAGGLPYAAFANETVPAPDRLELLTPTARLVRRVAPRRPPATPVALPYRGHTWHMRLLWAGAAFVMVVLALSFRGSYLAARAARRGRMAVPAPEPAANRPPVIPAAVPDGFPPAPTPDLSQTIHAPTTVFFPAETPVAPVRDAARPTAAPTTEPPASRSPDTAGLLDYLALMEHVLDDLQARQYGTARRMLEAWLAAHPGHSRAEGVRDERARVAQLEDFAALFERHARALKGVKITNGEGIVGAVESIEHGLVTATWALAEGKTTFTMPLSELSDGDVARLLKAVDPGLYPARVALYLASLGDYDTALAWCDEGDAGGVDTTASRGCVEDWREARRGCDAVQRVDTVAAFVAEKRFVEARRTLAAADESFAGHPVYAYVLAPRIKALRAAIAHGLASSVAGPAAAGPAAAPTPGAAALRLPSTREQVLVETRRAVRSAAWSDYRERIDDALVELATRRGGGGFTALLDNESASLCLAQSAVLTCVTPRGLADWSGGDRSGSATDFLDWVFARESVMNAFLEAVRPEDRLPRVLALWCELWAGDPEGRDRYVNLALACAVVFDRPVKGIDPQQRYRFFREAARDHRLRVDPAELPAEELVWVVDAPVSDAELAWAQRRINLPRMQWGQAYGMVRYRMEKAVSGERLFDDYTLANILREGGICSDQAYFAAMTAKANGIPATIIVGEGQRGGHAWFGYKASDREWNLSTGRYSGDRFAVGTILDPQTGERRNEHTLELRAYERREPEAYARATRLTRLGRLLAFAGRKDAARSAYEQARETCPRHVGALMTYLEFLKRSKDVPDATWDRLLDAMTRTFRDYPDIVRLANALAIERLTVAGDVDAAVRELQQQNRRLDRRSSERTDLILENVARQVTLLTGAGRRDEVAELYYNALRDYGREVVAFRTLALRYFDFACTDGDRHDALRRIESVFRRYYPEPGGDYFQTVTRAGLMTMLAGLLDRDEQYDKAERIRREARQLTERAGRRYE